MKDHPLWLSELLKCWKSVIWCSLNASQSLMRCRLSDWLKFKRLSPKEKIKTRIRRINPRVQSRLAKSVPLRLVRPQLPRQKLRRDHNVVCSNRNQTKSKNGRQLSNFQSQWLTLHNMQASKNILSHQQMRTRVVQMVYSVSSKVVSLVKSKTVKQT